MFVLFIVFLFLLVTSLAQDGWFWQNPLPQGNNLYDICSDANHPERLFAVGDHGTILRKDNLTDWEIVEQGNFENLYSVYFKGDYGWAVGLNGTILQNIDGEGTTWYPLNNGGTDKMLLSVFFYDQLNGWIVGQEQTILHTSDGGSHWNTQYTAGSEHYFSVYFTSLLNGWIAGAANQYGVIKKTTDGGTTWTNSLIPTNRMNSIKFVTENIGCSVGDAGRIFTTSNAGANWNLAASNTTSDLKDFYMTSSGEGRAVGYDGTIIHTMDFGNNWNVETSPTNQTLYGIEGDYAIGWAGTILHHSVNWEIISQGYTDHLSGIDFDIFTDYGYAVGNNGLILKTTDAGNTWLSEDSGTNYDLYDVEALYTCSYFDPDAVVVGEYGTVRLSYSGNWQQKNILTTDKLYDIYLAGFTGQMFVAGEWGRIWKTTNYGDNWSLKHENTSYHLHAIDFGTSQTGYAAGMSGALLKTTDDGETWFDISPGSMYSFRGIDFRYGRGWVVGLNGVIFRTTDGGETWIETLPKVTYETLNKVKFVDENRGWIVGDNGTILITSDGGENWYIQDSPSNGYLTSANFPENGIGWICGWDGAILHTTDGGGTIVFEIYERDALNLFIPDPGEVSDIIDVSINPGYLDDYTLSGVTVIIDSVLHSDVSELLFLLTHNGITDTLITVSEIADTNILHCSLADAADVFISEGEPPYEGSYKPHNPLSVFSGMDPNGIWTLKVVDMVSGNSGILQSWGLKLFFDNPTSVESDYTVVPQKFEVYQNFPNPFNPSTTIRWQQPESGFVTLTIYDVLGREVTTLVNEELSAGKHEIIFESLSFSSGVYFYQIRAGNFIQTKKMILLK
jgi:photosystem II stability/assembly factor-like uncharacterized protein